MGGVKVYDKNVSRNEILMDVDLFYAGDCDISFTLAGVSGTGFVFLRRRSAESTLDYHHPLVCRYFVDESQET